MAITDENGGMVMPVTPMGYGGNSGGFGFGGDWAWILLLLVLGGGWGGFGGFGMGNAMAADGFGLYPWLNNSEHISDGFRDQQISGQVTGIQNAVTTGFGDIQTALCGGFAGVNAGISNGFAQAEIANNARQIADMQQSFAAQTATMQGFNGLQSQLAQCCCDNRAGLADLRYTVATENCADRAALADGLRDVLAATQAQTQAILDKMCQQELEAERRENSNLRTQLSMAQLAASQSAQTAALEASNSAQTQYIVNRVAPYPIPAYTVANPVTPAYAG